MNKKILIADPEESTRQVLGALLSTAGYETVFATDGTNVIAQVRRHQPHLILIDLNLPAGNAVTVMDWLRRLPEFAQIPVLVLAGREDRMSANLVFDAGASAFLAKPLNRQRLLSSVAGFLTSDRSFPVWNLEPPACAL